MSFIEKLQIPIENDTRVTPGTMTEFLQEVAFGDKVDSKTKQHIMSLFSLYKLVD